MHLLGEFTTHGRKRCCYTYTESIPVLAHAYGAWVQTSAPKCESMGEERRDCDNCDHSETRAVNAVGHSFGEWVVTTDPTKTSNGLLTKTCTNDATHRETLTLLALSTTNGYTYKVILPATNTENGLGRFTYKVDGQTFTFDVVIAANETEFDPR